MREKVITEAIHSNVVHLHYMCFVCDATSKKVEMDNGKKTIGKHVKSISIITQIGLIDFR